MRLFVPFEFEQALELFEILVLVFGVHTTYFR
jgi:hypothetical protein